FAGTVARGDDDPGRARHLERVLRDVDKTYRLSVPDDQPIAERLHFDVGASARFGYYLRDDSFDRERGLRQWDGRVYALAELDGTHRLFGRLRFLYEDFDSGDSFDGRGDRFERSIADRYWYEFDSRGAGLAATGSPLDLGVRLKVGRQYVHWNSGLALSHVLYASQLDVELYGLGLSAMVGRTPSEDTIDFDGSRPDFSRDTDRLFYGSRLEYRGSATHRPFISFLGQRDQIQDDLVLVNTSLGGVATRFDYDSYYLSLGSRGSLGPLAYRAELVYEFGKGLSDPIDQAALTALGQDRERIHAFAGLVGLTFPLDDASATRVDLDLIAGSGDDDRIDSSDTVGGNRQGSRDTAFNSLGYVDTGLVLAPDPSNLFITRVGASSAPLRTLGGAAEHLRLGIDGLLFWKLDAEAPADVATNRDLFVGGEIDLSLDWQILSDVTATMRYGMFIPGEAIPNDRDHLRHFFYVGLTYEL
ncbi:MAG: alginate export family protein, partial [Planctomycetota bacterium]